MVTRKDDEYLSNLSDDDLDALIVEYEGWLDLPSDAPDPERDSRMGVWAQQCSGYRQPPNLWYSIAGRDMYREKAWRLETQLLAERSCEFGGSDLFSEDDARELSERLQAIAATFGGKQ